MSRIRIYIVSPVVRALPLFRCCHCCSSRLEFRFFFASPSVCRIFFSILFRSFSRVTENHSSTKKTLITREFRLKKDHHHHHHHHVLYDLLLSVFLESVLRFVVVEEDEPREDDASKSCGEDCERFHSLSSKSSSKEQEEKEIRKRHRGSIVGFRGDAKSAVRTDRSWENNLGLARGRERVSRVVETREKRKNGWRVYYYPTGVGEPVRRSRG